MENKFRGQALNLNVIVKEFTQEIKTEGGLDLTGYTDANEKQKSGIIVSIGTECPQTPKGEFKIKEGQKVIFDKFKATPFTQDGIPYTLVCYLDLIWTE
jgi:co-chaperonin GroES (HSP10)